MQTHYTGIYLTNEKYAWYLSISLKRGIPSRFLITHPVAPAMRHFITSFRYNMRIVRMNFYKP